MEKDAEKPPPKAGRVQVLVYDSTPRHKTQNLDVYERKPPARPFKVIALLTCEGAVDQEIIMTTAIFYRARLLGADGIMTLEPQNYGEPGSFAISGGPGYAWAHNHRRIYRGHAIVYEDR